MIRFTPGTWQTILGFTVLDPDGCARRLADIPKVNIKERLADYYLSISFTSV